MVKFKKLLSVALSASLIVTSALLGMSVSAAETAIKATPITGWTKLNNNFNYVTPTEVTPVDYLTGAKGIKLSLAAANPIHNEDTVISSSKVIAQMQYKADPAAEGDYYALPDDFKTNGILMVYVKTDSANKMHLNLLTQGKWSYFEANTLKLNSTYEYAAVGADKWTEKTVSKVATATENEQYNGLIEFDAAFEGYIKIPATSIKWNGTANIGRIETKFASIGGDYGEVTVGPFFYVTADSTSTKIEVPEAYRTAPIQATPLTGWTKLNNNFNYVTPTEVTPVDYLTGAKGIKLSLAAANLIHNVDTAISSSKVIAQMQYKADPAAEGDYYALPDDFKTNGILMVYVKTDSANKMHLNLLTQGKWSYFEANTLKLNSTYEYAAVGADKWTEKTVSKVATATENEQYNGLIEFDAAFEGYIKIPATSIKWNGTANIGRIETKFASIGGEYGEVTVGPFFYVTADSASTKIEVPEEFKPAPIQATPLTGWTKLNNKYQYVTPTEVASLPNLTIAKGIKLSLASGATAIDVADTAVSSSNAQIQMQYKESKNATVGEFYALPNTFKTNGTLIIYVKTDSANKMHFNLQTQGNWSYLVNNTLNAGSTYKYAKIGDNEWTEKTISENSLIEFEGAFEGYVKIPAASLSWNGEAKNYIGRIEAKFAKVGGENGTVTFGPLFYVTADSASTKIEVPDEFKPAPIEVKSVDFKEVGSGAYIFSADSVENGYKLYIGDTVMSDTETKYENGLKKWSYVEEEDTEIGSSGLTNLIMDPTIPLAPKDSEGFIVYLKTESANALAFSLEYENGTHWSKDYAPQMLLKPGTTVSVCPTGSDTWEDKPVEIGNVDDKGVSNTLIYGKITFDAAFEGYVKIPYSALNNDSGWEPFTTFDNEYNSIDRIKRIVFRFKGIGGKYGDVTVGLTGYITADSPSVKLNVNAPVYDTGDVNNDWLVNNTDFAELRKYLLGIETAEANANDANINKDTEVNILDIVRLKAMLKVQ